MISIIEFILRKKKISKRRYSRINMNIHKRDRILMQQQLIDVTAVEHHAMH